MPRGNDPAPASEMRTAYGDAPNAEALISLHRLSRPRELVAAGNKQVNVRESEELDLDKVASAAGLEKGQVEAAAVRGKVVTYVYDDNGTHEKGYLVRDGENLSLDEDSVEMAELRAERERRAEHARLAREIEDKVDEYRAKLAADSQAKAEKIDEQADKDRDKATAAAAKREEKEADKA